MKMQIRNAPMGQFDYFFQMACTVLHVQRFYLKIYGSHHAEMEVHFLGSF